MDTAAGPVRDRGLGEDKESDLEKDLWKASIKTLIILAKIKFRCEELERISENLEQTVINGY